MPELERLGRTISAWEDQLLAYFSTGGVSNGPTEAVNLLVKRIKRAGFGFRNFATIGSACCCTAASAGTLPDRHGSEAGHHVLWRRAELAGLAPLLLLSLRYASFFGIRGGMKSSRRTRLGPG